MLKSILIAGASALTLSIATPAVAQEEDSTPLPSMSFGEWGIDPSMIDQSVDPGDDFNAYVNGKWIAANPLPPEFSRFGAFTLLGEKSTADVKDIIDGLLANPPAPGTSERRIIDAYSSFMDTDAIDAAGLAPVYPYLTSIVEANTLEKLATLWGTPGYDAPVGGFVTVDSKQPDQYIVGVGQGGLGLPDREYYLDTSEKGVETQTKYREYLTFLMKEAGYADPQATADAVYAFEDKIARTVSWDRTVLRNRDLTYNAVDQAGLLALSSDFPLATMLEVSGLDGANKFTIFQMPPTDEEIEQYGLTEEQLSKIGGGVPGMFELLADTPVATLQAWTSARFLSGNAAVLPSRFDHANFEFFGKFLRGQQEQRPRWKRATDEVEGMLGEQLGAVYVERFFPPANKAVMDELVENLRTALGQSIAENDWMTPETKTEAAAKLAAFTPKIGYRDNLETYEGLEVVGGDPLANRMASAEWQWQDNVSKLGQPIDKTEWFMLPQTVNAYYSSAMNEIVFPAGILQPPFFNLSADPAVNYGAIGAVIGHEMGHGFDDQGSKSDGTGLLRDWWQPEDKANFEAKGDKLVEQYNQFCPYDDGQTCMNGRLSLGENIGDVGGLSMAYRAYRLSLNGEEAPVIDGFTGDQRFFMAWAQVWRSMQTEENGRQRLRTGPHSLEQYRVIGPLRNMDAWYEAFNVTEDDDLYLPPEERVVIW